MKRFLLAAATSLFFTLLVFAIHVIRPMNSMINFTTPTINVDKHMISDDCIKSIVDYHKQVPVFGKRPITTFMIEKLANTNFLSVGESFVLINFLLFFVAGILLFYLSMISGSKTPAALLSVVMFFSGFTIVFAFFSPIYSYDEPLQYCLVLASFIALLKNHWPLFIIFFALGLIVRESGLLLVPAIAFYILPKGGPRSFFNKNYIKKLLLLAIPVAVYFLFLFVYIRINGLENKSGHDLATRLDYLNFNFQNTNYASETLISMLLALGLPCYFLYWYTATHSLSDTEKILVRGFVLTLIINTFVILLTTKARETRLFALPLLFLWPLMGKIIISEIRMIIPIKGVSGFFRAPVYLAFVFLLAFFNHMISKYVFVSTDSSTCWNFFNEYLFVVLTIISTHFVLRTFLNRLQNNFLTDK